MAGVGGICGDKAISARMFKRNTGVDLVAPNLFSTTENGIKNGTTKTPNVVLDADFTPAIKLCH